MNSDRIIIPSASLEASPTEPVHDHTAVSPGVAAVSGGLAGAAIGQLVGGRLGAAIGAVMGSVAGVALNKEAGDEIQQKVEGAADSIKGKVEELQPQISTAVDNAVDTVKDRVQAVNPSAADAIDRTADRVKSSVQNFTDSGLHDVQNDAPSDVLSVSAIEVHPMSVDEQYNQGLELSRADKLTEAIAAFQSVVAREPDYPEAHYNLGVVLGQHGAQAQGIHHIQQARDLCRTQGRLREATNIEQILHKLGA